MSALRMQPTFRRVVVGSVDDVLAKLQAAIATGELAGHAESAGRCLDFKIEVSDRRFWSPHLGVQLSEVASTEDASPETELYCRFSPRPEVWTLVMMVYFGAACMMFFASVYGYAQWALGSSAWALLLVPLGAGLIAGLHLASLIGQRLSTDQMTLLRTRFDRACTIAFGDSQWSSD